jgi:hypothetical protein
LSPARWKSINRTQSISSLAGGETRAYDWGERSARRAGHLIASLRTTIRIVFNTRHLMFIWWGPDLIQFYTMAARPRDGHELIIRFHISPDISASVCRF